MRRVTTLPSSLSRVSLGRSGEALQRVRILGSHALRQAGLCALGVAVRAGLLDGSGCDARALAKARVHAVERALHGQLRRRRRVLGALRTAKLWVTQALAVAAPSVARAVAGARLQRAVEPAVPGLAPAATVDAATMARAVAQALRLRAVLASPLRSALAHTLAAQAVARAVIRARRQLAIVASPPLVALAG